MALSNAVGAEIVDGHGHATIVDNDTAGITLTLSSELFTTESGGTTSFGVVLDSEPTGNVTVTLSSSDTSEGTVSPSILAFTPSNWNIAQMATLTGVNDPIDDGDISYLVTADAASDDANYNGLSTSAAAMNQDNDAVVTHGNNVVRDIPDPGKVASRIVIDESRKILDVNVRVNITHDRDQDLDVLLVTPWGTRIELFTDVGGNGSDFTSTVLDDEAATAITAGKAPFTGDFRPERLLSAADGQNTLGTWALEITDDKKGPKKGRLNSWSLTFLGEQADGSAGNSALSNSDTPVALDNDPWIQISEVSKALDMKGMTNIITFATAFSGAYDERVTIFFRVADDTAKADENYVAKSDTRTLAPGETTKAIAIEVSGDDRTEANEAICLDLTGLSSSSLFAKNRGSVRS